MFNTFVRSKLEYASPIWNPHHKYLIDRLESVQRRFTIRIPILRDVKYGNRLKFLKIDSLELRRLHLDLVFLYKLLHGHLNIDINKYFDFKISNTRGHSMTLKKRKYKKDIKKYSFAQRIVDVWNFLPDNVVNATSIASFKKSLHSIDFGRYLKGEGPEV